MAIVVELVSNICNSKCKWCFSTYETSKKIDKGFMAEANFKKFIDINKGAITNIIPFSHGESLLHPDWVNMMEYATSNGYVIESIHTNLAMPLTNEHMVMLCRVKYLTINVGGANKDTHYINTGTDFNVVSSNLQRLMKVRREPTSVKMVINKHNQGQKEELVQYIKSISTNIQVSTFPLYLATADSDQIDISKWIENNIAEGVECRDHIENKNGQYVVKPKTNKCTDKTVSVRFNGITHLCCRARTSEGSVGNAFITSIKDILASDKCVALKKLMDKRQYISYCKVCS